MRRVIAISSGIAVIVLLVVVFGRGLFWAAEGTWPADDGSAASLDVVYPADGSIFPPDFVAPTFLWRDKDSQANRWAIEVASEPGGEPLRFYCEGAPPPPGEIDKTCIAKTNEIYVPYAKDGPVHSWTPDTETWKRIQQQCGRSGATVTIVGFRKEQTKKALSRGRITISVSKDPVGAPIFYRDVPLMPSKGQRGVIKPLAKWALSLIVWRLRDVSRPESRVVMKDMPSCANCHTFSSDGKTLGMDVDGPSGDKGAYGLAAVRENMVIEAKDLITWNSFPDKPKGHKTIGFMSQISPDGQYVVTTVNEHVFVTNFTDYKFVQVFYPTRGILAYYSRRTGRIKALGGADDPAYVHCDPTWSPDGKYLVFARAKARDPYLAGGADPEYANDPKERPIQYDLYRIPFNGGRGGTAEPIAGASQNGMSNTFPKISPDGRWIVLVKCRNGQLMRPDSRLWIVPAAGGQAREMQCNTSLMNSWHSFSPNGRWMVFSSKSITPYTQMFLTHIDEQGRDSPAILIPNSTAANRAVNLPEFANIAYGDLVNIDVPVVDWRRPLNLGGILLEKGKPREALEHFRKSLHIDPQQARTHFALGKALDELKRTDEAVKHYRKAIEINPDYAAAHGNLGDVLRRQGKIAEAIEQYRQALRIKPDYAEAHNNLGVALERQGKIAEAIEHYHQALRIKPGHVKAHNNLGIALERQGKLAEAIERYTKALKINPKYAPSHNNLGNVLRQLGKTEEAIGHYQQALRIKPDYAEAYNNLGNALLGQGKIPEGIRHYQQALRIKPDFAMAHNNLGNALLGRGKLAEAIEHFRRALRIEPDYAEAHYNLGNAHQAQGKLEEAIEHYRLALRIEPDFAMAHNNLANALQGQGKLEEAVKHYRHTLRIKPDFAQSHYNLAVALRRQGKLAEAGEHYRRAAQIVPDFAEAHNSLADVLRDQGKIEEAIKRYHQALRIKPKYVPACNSLAWLLATSHDAKYRDGKKAVQCATLACRLTGWKNAGCLDTLAAAYAEAGNFPEAAATATKALGLTKPNQKPLAEKIRLRLEHYKARRPYRQQR